MNSNLKNLIDQLDESETLEVLEYSSERLKSFNSKNGPVVDFSKDPKELAKAFMDAISILNLNVVDDHHNKK